MTGPPVRLRIGELSRRTRVSPELLRAWESRYGLLLPERTSGGFRLYSEGDERRVRRMHALVASGLAAGEAAAAVLEGQDSTPRKTTVSPSLMRELDAALMAFDEPGAHAVLDRLFATVTLDHALVEGILPELRSVGDRWSAGSVSVAQEHFAATLVRGRLLALARGWDQGRGPRAILAALPGELHDIGLISFGLLLRLDGWRIVYLGQDTPLETIDTALGRARADALVVASVERQRFERVAKALGPVARRVTTAIGGAGATQAVARRLRATLLAPDPRLAVAQLRDRVVGSARGGRGALPRRPGGTSSDDGRATRPARPPSGASRSRRSSPPGP